MRSWGEMSKCTNCNFLATIIGHFFKLGMVILVDNPDMLMSVDSDNLHIYEEAGPNIILRTIVCMHNNSTRGCLIITILGGWVAHIE